MELPGAGLGKEQLVPTVGLGWGREVRVSLKLTQGDLLNSTEEMNQEVNLPREVCRKAHGRVCVDSMATAIEASQARCVCILWNCLQEHAPWDRQEGSPGCSEAKASHTFSHLIIKSKFFIKICRICSLTISMNLCIRQELLLTGS